MTKIVQLSERKNDGTLDPFYPMTHAEGMEGLDIFLTNFGVAKTEDVNQLVNGVQKSKITADDGGFAFSMTDVHEDAYACLLSLEKGMHYAYIKGGAVNGPARSVRGTVLIEEKGKTGHIIGVTEDNRLLWNTFANSTFTGWMDSNTTKEVWSGGYHMAEGQEIQPSIRLDNCKAWLLYWTKYTANHQAQDYYHYTQIVTAAESDGKGHSILMQMDGKLIYKYVYVFKDRITGAAGNNVDNNAGAVLRKVVAMI